MKRFVLVFTVVLVLSAACTSAPTPPPVPPATLTPTALTVIGTVSESGPLGQMSPGFTGVFGGIQFKLTEQPDKIFKVITDSFEEAAKIGVRISFIHAIEEFSVLWRRFQDLVGWKVEAAYEITSDGSYKVISFKKLNP